MITTPVAGDIFVNDEYRGTRDINIELEQGVYTINFGDVNGYVSPQPLNVIINPGFVTLITIEYTR